MNQDIVGVSNELRELVTAGLSADAAGNVGFQALATPALVGLIEVDESRVFFAVEAADQREPIARGRHARVVVDSNRFDRIVARKTR